MGLLGNNLIAKIKTTNATSKLKLRVCDDTGKYSPEERLVSAYSDKSTITGVVSLMLKSPGSRVKHKGITLVISGIVVHHFDNAFSPSFTSRYKQIVAPGYVTENMELPFEFEDVSLPYDSYYGKNTSVVYSISVIISKQFGTTTFSEPIYVHNYSLYPEKTNSVKMIVGLQNCIQLQLEINKANYHLKDIVLGRLTFLQVKAPITRTCIQIEMVEISHKIHVALNGYDEKHSTTLCNYEILSGSPTVGLSIPFRIFLKYLNLTPTMKMIDQKLSTKFFVVVNAFDISGRRYYKQEEVIIWRKMENSSKNDELRLVDSESLLEKLDIPIPSPSMLSEAV